MVKGNVLITGAAGFIGFHLSRRLLESGYTVIGLDNLNDYYDVSLKQDRLLLLKENSNFTFYRGSIEDNEMVNSLLKEHLPEYIVHLAAQVGVRYSLENPMAYINSNVVGFLNILEACRAYPVKHLVYASSSSVYGGNIKMPYATFDNVDHPVSLYAATKKSNELMAHTYSHLFNISTTGLRFFTVYGPWGRPDMAYYLFTKAILASENIKVFNHGLMERDFTYIDDIVEAITRVMLKPAEKFESGNENLHANKSSIAPYRVYNIGSSNPNQLEQMISIIEKKIGRKAIKKYLPMQAGDVLKTYADIEDLSRDFDFQPKTSLEKGIDKFVDWYRNYYKV